MGVSKVLVNIHTGPVWRKTGELSKISVIMLQTLLHTNFERFLQGCILGSGCGRHYWQWLQINHPVPVLSLHAVTMVTSILSSILVVMDTDTTGRAHLYDNFQKLPSIRYNEITSAYTLLSNRYRHLVHCEWAVLDARSPSCWNVHLCYL